MDAVNRTAALFRPAVRAAAARYPVPRSAALCALACIMLLSGLPPGRVGAADRVLAVTTDWWSAGSVSTLESAPPWTAQIDLESVNSDAVARVHGGMIYVVNRLGADNIQLIDPADFHTVRQFSVGAGSNPQDIAVLSSDRAFVSCYETNDLLEVDPSSGQILGSISLAALADGDGLCEMQRMHVQGGYLYVQVQRMLRRDWPDPWIPAPPSYLAVIDLNTSLLVDADPGSPGVQGIALQGTNPVGPMQVEPETGLLLVPEAGQYGVVDNGGIERVNLSTWQSEGMAVTEAALGGDVLDFALWSANRAYAIATDPSFSTRLISWNPGTGQVLGTVFNPGDYTLMDVLVHSPGYLFVADRNYTTPGVRVYDADSGGLLSGPIDTGLPPFELVLLPDPSSGVDGQAGAGGLFYPNPSSGPVRFAWSGGLREPLETLEVFDPAGRLVLVRQAGTAPGGEGLASAGLVWDGRDRSGLPAPAGVYFLRITGESGRKAGAGVRILR